MLTDGHSSPDDLHAQQDHVSFKQGLLETFMTTV